MSDWDPRVNDLFAQAAALPAAERPAFLDRACGGDPEARAAVESLLEVHLAAEGFLSEPHPAAGPPAATAAYAARQPKGETAGAVVGGRYKLLEPIGEGGMGTVWMADQLEPVRRRVAVKLIRPEREGAGSILARFEAERQAIALMDHPNIARLLDAGETAAGRPFFVMELVRGKPVTEFCDERRMSVRARLELFVQVCHAVQHAHQKGVIHRDLKPSNVLVELHEDRPVPKVIDFGLAKAAGGRPLTDRTLFTAFGTVAGTPLYMAPEQARLDAVDVDTRADVYALGVILYELLTGGTPLERAALKQAALDELLRLIRESEPPAPSKRISSTENVPSVAASRHSEPAALARQVRGDLDWIVMKALEKDRTRRYETANGFSLDVQRYLADEPVQACPPSAAYRLKKFVRRNRASVVAASLVFLALVAGVVGASWGLVSARAAAAREARARDQAEANFALAGDAVEEFLGAVTDDPDLSDAGLNHVRKKLLVKAIPFFQKIAEQKGDDPRLQASRGLAYRRLTITRQKIGEYEAALQDSEAGRAIFAKLVAERPQESSYRHALANFVHNSALSQSQLGRRQEAEAGYRQAISMMEQVVAESPSEGARHDLARGYADLGSLLRDAGKRDEAEAAFGQALTAWEALGRDFPAKAEYRLRQASTHNALGLQLIELGKYEEGEKAFRRSLALGEQVAQSFPEQAANVDASSPLLNLAVMFDMRGRFQEALEPIRRAVEIDEKLAGQYPASPAARRSLAHALNQQGNVLAKLGKPEEALAAFQRALGIRERLAEEYPALPEHRQRVAESLMGLGNALIDVRKYAEAETVIKRALDFYERLAAERPDHLERAVSLGGLYCNLGFLKVSAGAPEDALGLYEKAIARLEGVLAREPQLATAKEFLANSYGGKIDALHGLGRHAETLQWAERTYALFKRMFGPTHPRTATAAQALIEVHDFLKRFDAALELRRELAEIRRQTLGPDHPATLGAMANVAVGHKNLGDHAEAIKRREEVLALMKAKIPNHEYRLRTMGALAASYDAVGRPADAKRTRAEAIAVVRSRLAAGDPSALSGALALARVFAEDGRGAEAAAVVDDAVRKMAGKSLDAGVVVQLLELRLQHFVKAKDLAGVRTTAEYFERLNLEDAAILYDAACCRAVAAAFVRAAGGPDAARDAAAEADRAMEWLRKAVAAGWRNVAHLKRDDDLDALRDRDDFKKLVADLEAKSK